MTTMNKYLYKCIIIVLYSKWAMHRNCFDTAFLFHFQVTPVVVHDQTIGGESAGIKLSIVAPGQFFQTAKFTRGANLSLTISF